MTIYLHSFHHSFASNGIKITYELIRYLNDLGYNAKNLCFDPYIENSNFPEVYLKNTVFCTQTSFPKIKDDDIVIYPEHVSDNPLGAKFIVRYLLNKPYYLFGYGIDYLDTDFIIAFSPLVNQDFPILYLLIDERETFNAIRKNSVHKDDSIAIYFGKCNLKLLSSKKHFLRRLKRTYKNIYIITRQFPSRLDALKQIAESKMLVSFDPLSNLNYEATLLETPVFLIDDSYETKNINLPVPQKGIFYTEDAFEKARQEVKKSYIYYCEYLTKQSDVIKGTFGKIFEHFSKISVPDYLSEIRYKNSRQKEKDYEDFKNKRGEIYTHINFYLDIPVSIAMIFNLHTKKTLIKQAVKSILKKLHLLSLTKKIIAVQTSMIKKRG